MSKYSDDEIRKMKKITNNVAVDYLGVSPMFVANGMR